MIDRGLSRPREQRANANRDLCVIGHGCTRMYWATTQVITVLITSVNQVSGMDIIYFWFICRLDTGWLLLEWYQKVNYNGHYVEFNTNGVIKAAAVWWRSVQVPPCLLFNHFKCDPLLRPLCIAKHVFPVTLIMWSPLLNHLFHTLTECKRLSPFHRSLRHTLLDPLTGSDRRHASQTPPWLISHLTMRETNDNTFV